jgi:ubiquinone/menaquinone biosynthesis C-methylase UbiE
VSFAVAAEAYDRFMGVYARELAPQLADLAGVAGARRVLDVGCGPGALTAELVRRVGAEQVAAVDPSDPFVAAARERLPGVDVRQSAAESLPFPDRRFDAALAQLVVHFMSDPVAGLREMRRVTRTGGVVAACVWDYGGERAPLSAYWRAALAVDPYAVDESGLAGARAGHLAELFAEAGLEEIVETTLFSGVRQASFDAWWEPFTLGVGPAGAHARSLDADRLAEVRERCRQELGDGPFTVAAHAWAARGTVRPQA